MASNENIRKELGPDDRNLDPDLDFTPNKRAEAARQVNIWMTTELKQAAGGLLKSWEISHEDQMAALNIRDVNLKFSDLAKRVQFFEVLEELAKLVNPNYPCTYPLRKPTMQESSNTADGVWLSFWYKYFLPDGFDTVMQDVAVTELNSIPARSAILDQAKAYLKAYGMGFVRMHLVVNEGVDPSAVDSLTQSLREAQSLLLIFLKQLVDSLSESGVHHVIIQGVDEIEVDGRPSTIKGAALRALLALSLLRNNTDFKLEEFAKLFHGGSQEIAKTDFDNAIKALKQKLPNLSAQTSSKGHRTITGIKFQVRVDDALIGKRLAGFYKK